MYRDNLMIFVYIYTYMCISMYVYIYIRIHVQNCTSKYTFLKNIILLSHQKQIRWLTITTSSVSHAGPT